MTNVDSENALLIRMDATRKRHLRIAAATRGLSMTEFVRELIDNAALDCPAVRADIGSRNLASSDQSGCARDLAKLATL